MLSVIFIWLYIGITTFLVGYGVLRVVTRHLPYYAHACAETGCSCPMIRNADAYLMCGLVCVTVYAQFFSLFAGVGFMANLILCVLCTLTALVDRRALAATVRRLVMFDESVSGGGEGKGNGKPDIRRFCAVLTLFLLFAYGASRGMIHYDTGLKTFSRHPAPCYKFDLPAFPEKNQGSSRFRSRPVPDRALL